MKLMEFSEWISKKYAEWRGDAFGNDRSVSQFAALLGVKQVSLSEWMNGKYAPKSQQHINRIAVYYPDVYEVLGLDPPPDELSCVPEPYRSRISAALAEIRRRLLDRSLSPDSPEAESIAIETFKEFGLMWSKTSNSGNDRSVK